MSRLHELDLSPSELLRLFEYEPSTGSLIWKHRPVSDFVNEHASKIWNIKHAGKPAGIAGERLQLSISNKRFKLHRVIWAYCTGKWPEGDIDHIDGNPQNNRIENLRDVEHSENQKNLKLNKNNKSGFSGVGFLERTGRWKAVIQNSGKAHHLGYFATKEEAVAARKNAERRFGFHQNHGRAE